MYTVHGEVKEINRQTRYIRLYIKGVRESSFTAIKEFEAYIETDIPHVIRFQGNLGDSEGLPLDGLCTLTFRLYDEETAGTSLWEEIQENITIEDGLLDVKLGSVTPIELSFDKQYWLSVQAEGDDEMMPRFELTSVPYSFISEE